MDAVCLGCEGHVSGFSVRSVIELECDLGHNSAEVNHAAYRAGFRLLVAIFEGERAVIAEIAAFAVVSGHHDRILHDVEFPVHLVNVELQELVPRELFDFAHFNVTELGIVVRDCIEIPVAGGYALSFDIEVNFIFVVCACLSNRGSHPVLVNVDDNRFGIDIGLAVEQQRHVLDVSLDFGAGAGRHRDRIVARGGQCKSDRLDRESFNHFSGVVTLFFTG